MFESQHHATAIAESAERDEPTIDRCGRCQYRVALRRPTAALAASPWRCRRCHAVFLASPQVREGRQFSAGTRAAFYFDVLDELALGPAPAPAVISRQDLRRLKECFERGFDDRPELRKNRRYPILAAVTVLPLSSELQVADELCEAIAVNVSAGGIAIMSPRAIEEPFFAVDFSRASGALAPVLLEKLRVREVGERFEIAGRFVSRIEY
jgi:hypothetical protein